MLLRTSSSPGIKGAIFTVLSESPVRDFRNPTSNSDSNSNSSGRHHHHHKNAPSHLSFPPFSPTSSSSSSGKSSPSGPNREAGKGGVGFRRALSDSNIDRFAAASFPSCESNLQQHSLTPRRYPPRKRMLHSAPSFSVFTTTDGEVGEEEQKDGVLMRTVTIGESIGSGDFSFGKENGMGLIEEVEEKETVEEEEEDDDGGDQRKSLTFNKRVVIPPSPSFVEDENQPASPPMYLATGLGFDSALDFQAASSLLDEGGDLEEYYRKMLDQFPSHPLFLRNYAHLLQSKGDLHGAEEYYHRAIQVEPGDGEILMQYAKLVWELHRDQDRAMGCFERAAQAAPQDSNVLGAYAGFLWEIDEEEGDEEKMEQKEQVPVPLSAFSANDGEPSSKGGLIVEDHYRQMVEEHPNNALVLRNYAQFLYQTKGDMQGAEEYYSRAILADPGDGEIMSRYAKLVWELHRDQQKASSYFERAVQAAPSDSHVLAAYASFLWESEEDE